METENKLLHYLADRDVGKKEKDALDSVFESLRDKMDRRAKLVVGLKQAKDARFRLNNPKFRDKVDISIPSFRFQIPVELAIQELDRQIADAESELLAINNFLTAVQELSKGMYE